MEPFQIEAALTPQQIEVVRTLFEEYGKTPGVAMCVEGFAEEIAGLPGQYAPPGGKLFLLRGPDGAAGCVALRRLDDDTCEIKRLYVRPEYRGEGLGRMLVEEAIGEAFQAGYNRVCLDTLPSMRSAIRLYESYGFTPTEPYLENPTPGALCFELRISA